jgi:uncharacterized iron-regulated membrane protein
LLKKYFRKIHLWLGLLIGLLVFLIALTGSIYAFQEEIQYRFYSHYFVEQQTEKPLLPSAIQQIAENALPNKSLHSIKYYTNNRSVEVTFYKSEPFHHYTMFIHPKSGNVLHVQNMETGFFPFILKGHMYLWLPPEIGRVVVMVVTLLFFVIILSGLILWFPKNVATFKKRIWFYWNNASNWKRKNWDLHTVFGFYSCVFAFLFIVTGLVWVLPTFAEVYHQAIGGKKSMVYQDAISSKQDKKLDKPLDKLYVQYKSSSILFASIELHPPETDSASILVVTNPVYGSYWKSDYIFHDQYSLQELPVNHIWSRFRDATTADKILRLNYDLHVGSALGFWGKLLACLASLLIALLPVTGFLIWFGKQKKSSFGSGSIS